MDAYLDDTILRLAFRIHLFKNLHLLTDACHGVDYQAILNDCPLGRIPAEEP